MCSEETMRETRRQVDDAESKKSVTSSLEMAESILRFHLQLSKYASKLGKFLFSPEVENDFFNHLHTSDEMFFKSVDEYSV